MSKRLNFTIIYEIRLKKLNGKSKQLQHRGEKIKWLSYKRKLYLDRKSRHVRKVRKNRSDGHVLPPNIYFETPEDFKSLWTAPTVFGLTVTQHRRPLLRALHILRKKVAIKRENVTLDFSETEKLYADGTLLFLAELKRLLRIVKGEVEIDCILPNNNKVAQVLKQIGVLDLLGVKTIIEPKDDDVINWRTAHGNQVLGEKYDDILKEYDGEIAELLRGKLYTGITEAMANVINHAYDLPRIDGLDVEQTKEWWMFSQQQHGHLTIVFCDLGAGIPRTLPAKRPNVWRKIMRAGRTSDAAAIEYAVKDSISRTMKDHRGKGLGQIMKVVQGIKGGSANVLSNKGGYGVKHGSKPEKTYYTDSILGTLIFWRIPLSDKEAT